MSYKKAIGQWLMKMYLFSSLFELMNGLTDWMILKKTHITLTDSESKLSFEYHLIDGYAEYPCTCCSLLPMLMLVQCLNNELKDEKKVGYNKKYISPLTKLVLV